MLDSHIPKNLLFRYRIPCQRLKKAPSGLFELPKSHAIASFHEFEGQKSYADVRLGWAEDGIYFSIVVGGKKRPLKCQETDLLRSDGVMFWFDTRDTHIVHRATKFCHWMKFLPTGGGNQQKQAVGRMIRINRCKEESPAMNRGKLVVTSSTTATGYQISGHIPSTCLFGWDTSDHRQLGFNYVVADAELGYQTLAVGVEMPIFEDPSLWQTLVLND